jgi:hypothetical protein
VIDQRGDAVVRRNREEFRLELLALADVDRDDLVGQSGLFEKNRNLVSVRGGPVVEINHRPNPSAETTVAPL